LFLDYHHHSTPNHGHEQLLAAWEWVQLPNPEKWQCHQDQDDNHHNHHHHSTPNHGREHLLAAWKRGSSWEGDNDRDNGDEGQPRDYDHDHYEDKGMMTRTGEREQRRGNNAEDKGTRETAREQQ
jgi:hypothetical protein